MNEVFKAWPNQTGAPSSNQLHQNNGQTLNQLCRHLALTRQRHYKPWSANKADLVFPLAWARKVALSQSGFR